MCEQNLCPAHHHPPPSYIMSEPSYPNPTLVGGCQGLMNNLFSLEILLFSRSSCCVSAVAVEAVSISPVLKKAICGSRQAQELSKLGHSSQPNHECVAKHGESASDSSLKASKEGHKIIVQTINRMSTFCSFSCSLYNRCNMKSCYQWRVIQSDGSNKKNVSKSRIS